MRLILAIVLPSVGLGAVASQLAPARYTAESLVQIAPVRQQTVSGQPLARTPRASERDFQRQLRLLASAEVAETVLAELELDPELLHEPQTLLQLAERRVAGWLARHDGRISDALAYAARLELEPEPEPRRIRIAFTSSDPDVSARVANTHARIYAEIARAKSPPITGEAQRVLEIRLDRAQQEVKAARSALDAHRARHDIASIEMRSNAVITRVSQLDRRHVSALAERQRLEAQIELIDADQFDSLPAVTASDLVWHLKETAAQLRAQRARLQAEFRPDADQISTVEARLRGVRRRLSARIAAIAQEVRSQYEVAAQTEEAIRAQRDEQRERAEELERAVTEYARLERELISHQRTHRELEHEFQALKAEASGPAFEILLVREARVPELAQRERPTVLALSLLVGLLCGVGFALARERVGPSLLTPEQVESQLGLPTLGALPDFRREDDASGGLPGAAAVDEDEGSERAMIRRKGMEAFREIHSRILASAPPEPPCSLLFAGAAPRSGTTSVALNIAALLSRLKKPVLVIDADFRKARCHEVLRAENDIGLSDVLTRGVETFEAIHRVSDHLALLPAGPMPPDPSQLLASTEMAECLIALQKHYAYIVVDGPPLEPGSDSLLLSPLFDGVVLVADQPSSARAVVHRAVRALRDARAHTLGIVVNRAPCPIVHGDAFA
jgi:capsular exopolysaccharide synthesis family protein